MLTKVLDPCGDHTGICATSFFSGRLFGEVFICGNAALSATASTLPLSGGMWQGQRHGGGVDDDPFLTVTQFRTGL